MVHDLTAPPHDHKVTFYPSDRALIGAVGDYVICALREGAIALVIATPDHREALDEHLRWLGVDVAAALANGSFVTLDAAGTLEAFLDDDHTPVPSRFDAVVGDAVRRLSADGREVRAFGEMVAILWAEGYVGSALELEGLWNGLRGSVDFTLLCAYPASIQDHTDAGQLEEVCGLHSAVVGEGSSRIPPKDGMAVTGEVTLSLDETLAAPGSARTFVRDTLARWQLAHLTDDAAIIASELVTNALRHAESPAALTLSRVSDGIVITVDDRARRLPRVRSSDGRVGGRGLPILAALARDWGYAVRPNGKSVWAVVDEAPVVSSVT